ncbi:unnamed protein product [Durusdinium trenchii]
MREELQVKQRYVGWLLGKAGAAIADIEKASGCQIFVNQETKGLGYSTVQFMGSPQQISDARQAIEQSIDRAKVAREGRVAEESIEVEQRWVGWLLGKKGGLAKEIELETGAHILIDQSTSQLGYSTVVFSGTADQVDNARDRVNAHLEKAGAAPMAAKMGAAVRAQAVAAADFPPVAGGSRGSSISTQVTVEQQWVGWLLGKAGAAVKDIEASTGAKIAVNQDTKAQGYSVVSLSGTPLQVQAAYDTMTESLRRAGGALSELPTATAAAAPLGSGRPGRGHAPKVLSIQGTIGREHGLIDAVWQLANSLVDHAGQDALWRIFPSLQEVLVANPEVVELLRSLVPLRSGERPQQTNQPAEIQIDQKMVGWLLGGRGKTVQQIEEESGAKIHVDQSTKEAGYSIVRVTGPASAVQMAERRIEASISIAARNETAKALESGETADMEVEQRFVGWILGKSGTVLKQIQAQSGALVSIDQSTKELGYSQVRISGTFQQRLLARQLIEDKISEADPDRK